MHGLPFIHSKVREVIAFLVCPVASGQTTKVYGEASQRQGIPGSRYRTPALLVPLRRLF